MRVKIPYLTTTLETDIVITLYLAPLWWFLGFSIFIYQAVTFWLLVKVTVTSIVKRESLIIPKISLSLILLIIVYGLSLMINYPYNETIRTVASFYNLSFWIMGLALIIVVYNSLNVESIHTLSKALRFNVIVCGILAGISVFFWFLGHKEITYPTLLLKLMPSIANIAHLKASATMSFVRTDWFAFRPLPRVSIMSPYSTAAFLIMSIPLVYLSYIGDGCRENIYRWGIVFLGTFTALLMLARTDTVAFIIASAMVYTLTKKHRLGFIVLIIFALLISFPLLVELFDYIYSMRGGSSHARFVIYRETLNVVWRKNILMGIGIKPREDWIEIPIGSHSMYLSLLIKTGLMGLFAFLAFQLHVFMTWFRLAKSRENGEKGVIINALGISIIAGNLSLFTLDLDAPQLIAFMYFLLTGILTIISREFLMKKNI